MANSTIKSAYTAKVVDSQGYVDYTAEENAIWSLLYKRQIDAVKHTACNEFLYGLELLNLPNDRIPQTSEVSHTLKATTGWELAPVDALISFDQFFKLLANKKFPAATFIRNRNDLDYLKEPDIFHEIFGHCPLLTNPMYANFLQQYGQLGVQANKQMRVYLARLFWFTIEFGLIDSPNGTRIYGAGILSSYQETTQAFLNTQLEQQPFVLQNVLRTPYRIDQIQPILFVINTFSELSDALNEGIFTQIKEAREMGLFQRVDTQKESSQLRAC